jgi:6-phosphogluconolactonase/glucosamine-6-phosphate isomerase/deaminase
MTTISYQHIQTNRDLFVQQATQWLAHRILEAITSKGRCILGLSGGSTPGPVYEELGKSTEIDWTKVFVFAVDERYISAEEKDSNRNLLSRTLLKSCATLPAGNIIYPDTSLPLAQCISSYGQQISQLLQQRGSPDIVVLGILVMTLMCSE